MSEPTIYVRVCVCTHMCECVHVRCWQVFLVDFGSEFSLFKVWYGCIVKKFPSYVVQITHLTDNQTLLHTEATCTWDQACTGFKNVGVKNSLFHLLYIQCDDIV